MFSADTEHALRQTSVALNKRAVTVPVERFFGTYDTRSRPIRRTRNEVFFAVELNNFVEVCVLQIFRAFQIGVGYQARYFNPVKRTPIAVYVVYYSYISYRRIVVRLGRFGKSVSTCIVVAGAVERVIRPGTYVVPRAVQVAILNSYISYFDF